MRPGIGRGAIRQTVKLKFTKKITYPRWQILVLDIEILSKFYFIVFILRVKFLNHLH